MRHRLRPRWDALCRRSVWIDPEDVEARRAHAVATLPPSVAAFHLAFGPDGDLFVTAPTLGTARLVYRISPDGRVEVFYDGFGRPQGLAFDARGTALRRRCARRPRRRVSLRRIGHGDPTLEPEQLLVGGGLVGLAFDPTGRSRSHRADTVYRLDVRRPRPATLGGQISSAD